MRKLSYENGPILYLVATPIGNLEDITFRAVRILKEVSRIYCEDTRNSLVLLRHYDIKTPVLSYHEFSEHKRVEEIINYIKEGNDVAIISDAGLPVLSDPGFKLVDEAIKNDIAISTIPGPSAFISAFVASNLPTPFTFYGFLKPKQEAQRKELEELKYLESTLIFYEAPHRINETLKLMLNVLGDREIVIARELTKKFEEYFRGKISEFIDVEFRGELVLLVHGAIKEQVSLDERFKLIDEQIKLGSKPTNAIKDVAKMLNVNKQELYKEYLEYVNNGKNE